MGKCCGLAWGIGVCRLGLSNPCHTYTHMGDWQVSPKDKGVSHVDFPT